MNHDEMHSEEFGDLEMVHISKGMHDFLVKALTYVVDLHPLEFNEYLLQEAKRKA